jgi:hypothetical protein
MLTIYLNKFTPHYISVPPFPHPFLKQCLVGSLCFLHIISVSFHLKTVICGKQMFAFFITEESELEVDEHFAKALSLLD